MCRDTLGRMCASQDDVGIDYNLDAIEAKA